MKESKPSLTPAQVPLQEPQQQDLQRLSKLIQTHAPYDSEFSLPIPGVQVTRASRINNDLYHVMYQPKVCIVAQGSKSVFLGNEVFTYDPLHMLGVSVNLPISSRVTQASQHHPFLCMTLALDSVRVAELAQLAYPHGLPQGPSERGLFLGKASAQIVNAAIRLLELMEEPREAALLSGPILDEILLRLLRSPMGVRLAMLGQGESSVQRISRAIDVVRAHFNEALSMEDLARKVHMSQTTFHQHFKEVTGLSPLQYQKVLRLQEARRLMLSGMDATTASREVGYGSVSQFSREYSRQFGRTPLKDIAFLRLEGPATSPLN
ncbi:AraC family transcriptional regulator [Deinococcus roseus]|uniref:AraC family transcriptional regulator n=1 Tax=Deinococcus roseus TaxID=392414 RepID=A0ABQ2DL55_9DEIO|nr:AraC family transcriptional regulator [Deinococcus roseus]GGJ57439.1 AraC family transcriptional regulator [Deinococcus roseus]